MGLLLSSQLIPGLLDQAFNSSHLYRLLNALAFSPSFLAATWPCLARTLGLPLQIPRGASRGWDVPSLRGGMAGLQPVHAALVGTFCWYGNAAASHQ